MKRTGAFTLIELLVVVVIIALLIALIVPALAKAKEEAKLVRCQTNLHAIGIGFGTYTGQNKDLMPQSAEFVVEAYPANNNNPPKGYLPMSWAEALWIDGDVLQNTNFNGKMNNNDSWQYPAVGYSIFQCPKHDPQYEYGSDSRINQGYGMAWCANSNFNFLSTLGSYPMVFTPQVPSVSVAARDLNQGHIIAADGWELMGSAGAYTAPASSQYGVFQRHMRNDSLGANYLFGDYHAEWSNIYGQMPSPLNFNNNANWKSATYLNKLRIWAHGVSDR